MVIVIAVEESEVTVIGLTVVEEVKKRNERIYFSSKTKTEATRQRGAVFSPALRACHALPIDDVTKLV